MTLVLTQSVLGQERFNKTVPIPGQEASTAIRNVVNGYEIIIQLLNGTNTAYFLRTELDENGILVDSSTLQTYERLTGRTQYRNDTYYLCANKDSSSSIQSYEKPYLVKFGSDDDTVWTLHLKDFPFEAFNNRVIYVGGDTLITVGEYKETLGGAYKIYLSQVDTNGNEIWRQTYPFGSSDQITYSIEKTADNGYLIAGGTRSYGAGSFDWYLMKVDVSGNFEWHKWWGSPTGESCAMKKLNDGNYILYGGIDNQWGNFGSHAKKIDPNGDTIWTANLEVNPNNNDGFADFVELPNGDLFFIGSGVNASNLYTIGHSYKLNSDGQVLFHRKYSISQNPHYLEKVVSTSDGGFAIIGYAVPVSGTIQDAWIVKVDSMGCDVPLCYLGERDLGLETPILKTYPNPTDGLLTIELQEESRELLVYNASGKQLKSIFIDNQVSSYQLNLSDNEPGIYIIRLLSKSGSTIGQAKVIRK